MTATLTTTTRSTGALVGAGLAATAVASIATSTVAAAGSAAGISLDVSGAPIPVPGFAVLTAVFSLVGLALAAVLARTPGSRAAPSSARPWCSPRCRWSRTSSPTPRPRPNCC